MSATHANTDHANAATNAPTVAIVVNDAATGTARSNGSRVKRQRTQRTCECERYNFPHRWEQICSSYSESEESLATSRFYAAKPAGRSNASWEAGVPESGEL